MAFVSLFGFVVSLGLWNIFVRDIVKAPETEKETLVTSFILHLIGGFYRLVDKV